MTLRERIRRSQVQSRVSKKRPARRTVATAPLLAALFTLPLLTFLAPSGVLPSSSPRSRHSAEHPHSLHESSTPQRFLRWHDTTPLPLEHPRLSNHSLAAVRHQMPSDNRPSLHAVFVCQTPCCAKLLNSSLRALVRQTFVPSVLTIVHACASSAQSTLLHDVRRAIADETEVSTSYALRPELTTHSCPTRNYASCVLSYLARAGQRDDGFGVLLDEGVIFEPTAMEKAYISLLHRSDTFAIRMLSYNYHSLLKSYQQEDPLLVRRVLPRNVTSESHAIVPFPLFYSISSYQRAVTQSYHIQSSFAKWAPLVSILSHSSLLREALFTRTHRHTTLSLDLFPKSSILLPAHLHSELAFYKWSARNEESEMYRYDVFDMSNSFATLDLSPIPFWPIENRKEHHIMFLLPWMQMGGSEKCILDIAQKALSLDWHITFVLTMPFWAEDSLGEMSLQHQWLDRALQLTPDTFDLLQLAPHQHSSRLLRHLLASRRPDFVLMANSRWAYSHASLINAVVPNAVVADYNHMIHMSWEGGGMPRFGANQTRSFDIHLTASHDVENSMRKWIAPEVLANNRQKVRTCYIGTDPDLLYSGEERTSVRSRMRAELGISEESTVVLYAGRFIVEKGIDIVADIARIAANDAELGARLTFLFVGSGPELERLESLPELGADGNRVVIVKPPAYGLGEMRKYYAMSDIFLLPSVNEGIALVLYEAMASGMLVMSTDVGGQRELITNETGVLLTNYQSYSKMLNHTVMRLQEVLEHPKRYTNVIDAGTRLVRNKFTTKRFGECVVRNLKEVQRRKEKQNLLSREHWEDMDVIEKRVDDVSDHVLDGVAVERFHGLYNRDRVERSLEGFMTIGVKTYVCDETIVRQVENLVRSIRVHYPRIRVILANDGPMSLGNEKFLQEDPFTEEHVLPADSGISYGRNHMVNATVSRYFLLLDDDHVFDDTTNLTVLLNGIHKDDFDIVGIRVRNLPGIDELERIGILIPRYVANITRFEDREVTLCVWNENDGPSVYGIMHPFQVDVLHNAFVAGVDVLRKHGWRNELKVNEHMTFFLDAKDAGIKVGYLPSVFVHHRARDYSDCYFNVRFREDKYAELLPYTDQFLWDIECQRKFPGRIREHIIERELAD
ncbi:Transferase [Gracilaria domingensis]|nr:Transferase [Gracilaria domingensis]